MESKIGEANTHPPAGGSFSVGVINVSWVFHVYRMFLINNYIYKYTIYHRIIKIPYFTSIYFICFRTQKNIEHYSPHYNGANQVCGHISLSGKPTPPFPYSIDYSASKQTVEKQQWQCVAFTYDGINIKSYLNGKFEPREPELINHTKGFEGYPEGLVQSKNPYHFPDGMGNKGSDFTVGAVLLKTGIGNFFKGQIGGLAVFSRALTDVEMENLGR